MPLCERSSALEAGHRAGNNSPSRCWVLRIREACCCQPRGLLPGFASCWGGLAPSQASLQVGNPATLHFALACISCCASTASCRHGARTPFRERRAAGSQDRQGVHPRRPVGGRGCVLGQLQTKNLNLCQPAQTKAVKQPKFLNFKASTAQPPHGTSSASM